MIEELVQLLEAAFSIFRVVYPPSLIIGLLALLLAIFLDFLYPYHRGLMLRIHPVHTCFWMARRLARPYSGRAYGVVAAFSCILIHVIPPIIILAVIFLAEPWISSILWLAASAWLLKLSISIRLLAEIGFRISDNARANEWEEARFWTQQIVRRDVYSLDEEHVLSAAIESLAESLVDGIVSPLFYYPLLGVIGPYLQRIVNTLDGAIGFKNREFEKVGWFSAKLDTIMNYLPARISALYIIFSSLLLGYDWRRAWRIWRRDNDRTESLNAGHPMAAMAGSLGVKLEKKGHYTIGDPINALDWRRVSDAVRIVLCSVILHLVSMVVILAVIYTIFFG
ncbi:MAG: cobalamin biosynthesis protein [Thaumarchaeota archaeon]|nr:cobalamin biosynthesis protein [Nitrososphaerota archaeon]